MGFPAPLKILRLFPWEDENKSRLFIATHPENRFDRTDVLNRINVIFITS